MVPLISLVFILYLANTVNIDVSTDKMASEGVRSKSQVMEEYDCKVCGEDVRRRLCAAILFRMDAHRLC